MRTECRRRQERHQQPAGLKGWSSFYRTPLYVGTLQTPSSGHRRDTFRKQSGLKKTHLPSHTCSWTATGFKWPLLLFQWSVTLPCQFSENIFLNFCIFLFHSHWFFLHFKPECSWKQCNLISSFPTDGPSLKWTCYITYIILYINIYYYILYYLYYCNYVT